MWSAKFRVEGVGIKEFMQNSTSRFNSHLQVPVFVEYIHGDADLGKYCLSVQGTVQRSL